METRPEKKSLSVLPFAAHAARGLIRDQGTRRRVMFAAVAFAIGLLIAGVTVLEPVLDHREHPVWFILFWFACAWLTVLALLLALFDVLIVRAQARVARKVLGRELPGARTQDSPDESAGR